MTQTPGENEPVPPVLACVQATLGGLLATPLEAGLYLVATPIGNLGDISLRALAVLARAQVLYCEDTRHSRTLLSHYGVRPKSLRSYHEHNEEHERSVVIEHVRAGRSVALISDAGAPLISDPGFKLVRLAVEQGLPVTSLPGACAAITAVQVAGLPCDSFHFSGFLPAKEGPRRERLLALKALATTLVFYETAPRLAASLASMVEILGSRSAAVARELTKLHETVMRGTLVELERAVQAQTLRGEIVVLVGAPQVPVLSDTNVLAHFAATPAALGVKERARVVAEALGIGKRRVYDLAIKGHKAAADE